MTSRNPGSEPSDARGFSCPCCGHLTLRARGMYEICQVCGWEDTGQDGVDADEYIGGPNRVSLTDARENFRRIGASEERLSDQVRPPVDSELPDGRR
ncbi:CPCC family cysteine-rich protein [Kitasatospora sp. NBC_00240]|uniref:CPCC family cysteine-rich protein n=1 Tax=Kitasatospora sp. NBC_00240 TaxID=2903567 RepID=UPI002251ABBF|nr:CPCC family cysteine-rich protein [Kitasatospora sp. NBC_00240]MCX5210621.1 CPCC family cysteine-rich protein [Kitasatospora sp. NBC_00240]